MMWSSAVRLRAMWLVVTLAACSGPNNDDDLTGGSGTTADSGGPVPVDADADGYDSTQDCDDDNPSVHPGAPELCDGVDNDCDLAIDDQAAATVDGTNYETLQSAMVAVDKVTEAVVDVCPSKKPRYIESVVVGEGRVLTVRGMGGRELNDIRNNTPGAAFTVQSGGQVVLDGVTVNPSQYPAVEVMGAAHAVVSDSVLTGRPSTVIVDNVVSKSPATLLVEGSEIRGVLAHEIGRGVLLSGLFQATLRDTKVSLFDGDNSNGAGINANDLGIGGSSLTLEGCTFLDNEGNEGAALYVSGVSTAAEETTFERNTAITDGGAVYLTNGATFDGMGTTTFTANEARRGGAIYIDNGALSGVRLPSLNSAAQGGGIAILRGNTEESVVLSDVHVIGSIGYEGGGIYVGPQTEVILDKTCAVHGNEALKSDGGGVFLAGVGAVLESQGATWSDGKSANTPADVAFNGGGSVTFSSATPQVRCTFADGACNPL